MTYVLNHNKFKTYYIVLLTGNFRVGCKYACDFLVKAFGVWLILSCSCKVDGFSSLVQSSVLGKGVKHKPSPIKLPSGSSTSSSGKQLFMQLCDSICV